MSMLEFGTVSKMFGIWEVVGIRCATGSRTGIGSGSGRMLVLLKQFLRLTASHICLLDEWAQLRSTLRTSCHSTDTLLPTTHFTGAPSVLTMLHNLEVLAAETLHDDELWHGTD